MSIVKTLNQLSYKDLQRHTTWVVVGGYETDELELSPLEFDSEGRVPGDVGEVWCLCVAVFANGTMHMASAMCRGDSKDGPLLYTVWNGENDVRLLLPPAPPFALARSGPKVFAARFGMDAAEVFPLKIEVVPRFAVKPEVRIVELGTSGAI